MSDLPDHSLFEQAAVLYKAIDRAASESWALRLPTGRFRIGGVKLRTGSRLVGAHGGTVLEFGGGSAFLTDATQ